MRERGISRTPGYNNWQKARSRCVDPADRAYPQYGARGIKMHEEWAQSFEAFLRDVGPRPTPAHSLDRIKGDKGYEPGNVRWATRLEQNQNRPGFVHELTHNGATKTVAEWARDLGLPADRIYKRLKLGMSVGQALVAGILPRGSAARRA